MVPSSVVGAFVVVVPKVFVEGLSEGGDAAWFVACKERFPELLKERVVDLFGFAVALGSLDVAVVDAQVGEGGGESVGDELVAAVGGDGGACPLVGGKGEGDLVGKG